MIQKGIILAGGSATRLSPLTKVTSKHLLPIYDEPLIYFPIRTLKSIGITNILIVCGPDHMEDFLDLLQAGKEFGVQFEYVLQEKPAGIAQGLSIAENFVNGDNVALILGDNIYFEKFDKSVSQNFTEGAQIFVTEVSDPERLGVVELEGDTVLSLEEKPQNPKSNWAQTGMYFYDNTVFEKIQNLKPSARGEYEITDVNKKYLEEKKLVAQKLQKQWIDAGTFESLFQANQKVRELKTGKS